MEMGSECVDVALISKRRILERQFELRVMAEEVVIGTRLIEAMNLSAVMGLKSIQEGDEKFVEFDDGFIA